MYKKYTAYLCGTCSCFAYKFLLIMKLTFILMVVALLQVSAATSYGQKISINKTDASLVDVLNDIRQQSGYSFLYNSQMLKQAKPVTFNVKNGTITQVLDDVFAKQPFTYTINQNTVIVTPKAALKDWVFATSTITGKVTDERGQALPGVTVKVKGTITATATNAAGDYSINVPDKNAVLVFTFLGYQPLEREAGTDRVINVVLKEQSAHLSEIVVIGYGDQSKKNLSTSISSIKAADVNELPVANLSDALAGKAAGVDVTSSFGGQPGVAADITIRGLGSLGSDNSPLYVVDGYPLESSEQFAAINPADIASIDILKDAASASIYGSRASNGVVIVTTKRGKAGKTKFALSTYTGVQTLAHKVALMDSAEYMHEETLLNTQRGGKFVLTGPYFGNTDWQDQLYHSAVMTTANLNATGGSENVQYNISASYLNQDGVQITSSFKRYGLRFNLDAKLTNKLKIGINLSPNYSVQHSVPNGGNFTATNDNSYGSSGAVPNVIYSALLMPPIVPLYMPDGRYGQPDFLPAAVNWSGVNVENPVAVLNSISNVNTNFQVLGNAYLQWDILKGLSYKLNSGGNYSNLLNNAYVSDITPTQFATLASFLNPNPNSIYAGESNYRGVDWLVENTLTYTHSFKDVHHLNVLLLQSAQKFSSTKELVNGTTGTYTSNLIQNPSASGLALGSVAYDLYTYVSYAGRINYDYKEKYFLSTSLRQDGSSKFGSDNRYGTFRSISGAWRAGEEQFIQKLDWISELKLRASYGETGNANIGSFTWLNNIVTDNYNFGATGSSLGNRTFGTNPSGYYNPDLTWEKNHQLDLGFEIGLLKDRIYFTADVYRKETYDMIQSKTLLGDVGYAQTYKTNTGDLLNKGLELALTTVNVKAKAFSWTTNMNISFNRNKVLDLGGPQALTSSAAITGWSNVFQITVGRPIGDIYGYKVNGILHNAAEVAAAPKFDSYQAQPGDMKFEDVNSDGTISVADRTVIGNTLPKFTGGMTNTFKYKGFDLSFVLTGRYGGNIINGNLRNAFGSAGFNMPKQFVDNIYLSSNPEANVKYPNVTLSGAYSFVSALTSLDVEDGSYLRMRNITAGYTFTKGILAKLKLQSLRIYMAGQNVFTWTKYTGYNPEVSVNGNSVSNPGVDQGVYPATRNFIAGINVGF
jgi:TonB-linked SusC/RagA family outer membrane protein